jgi:hypothetical protein
MSEVPEDRRFSSSDELLKFLREQVDDIDRVVIPVQEAVEVRKQTETQVVSNVGAVVKLCSGNSFFLTREDAAMLINDGVLQRLKIKCVLDPLRLSIQNDTPQFTLGDTAHGLSPIAVNELALVS